MNRIVVSPSGLELDRPHGFDREVGLGSAVNLNSRSAAARIDKRTGIFSIQFHQPITQLMPHGSKTCERSNHLTWTVMSAKLPARLRRSFGKPLSPIGGTGILT
jgi:hypothetical protein